jgi:hypothetical protein
MVHNRWGFFHRPVATENPKSSEKSRVLIITAVVSPACLSSSDRSFLGLPLRFRSRAVVELENLALRHQLHVERLIGSIRRECLDQLVIFNERQSRRVMSSYVDYYQHTRTHLSLDKHCQTLGPFSIAAPEESSPFQKSVACLVAPNVSPPDPSRTPAHQSLHGLPHKVV